MNGFSGIAEHAVDGWPAVPPEGWDAMRTCYLRAVDQAKRITAESDALGEPLLPPGVHIPALARESRGSGILSSACTTLIIRATHYAASVDGRLATVVRNHHLVTTGGVSGS